MTSSSALATSPGTGWTARRWPGSTRLPLPLEKSQRAWMSQTFPPFSTDRGRVRAPRHLLMHIPATSWLAVTKKGGSFVIKCMTSILIMHSK